MIFRGYICYKIRQNIAGDGSSSPLAQAPRVVLAGRQVRSAGSRQQVPKWQAGPRQAWHHPGPSEQAGSPEPRQAGR